VCAGLQLEVIDFDSNFAFIGELDKLLASGLGVPASRRCRRLSEPSVDRQSPLHPILYRHYGGQSARQSANQLGKRDLLMLQDIAQNVALLFFHAMDRAEPRGV
jgi:hypothetical protein